MMNITPLRMLEPPSKSVGKPSLFDRRIRRQRTAPARIATLRHNRTRLPLARADLFSRGQKALGPGGLISSCSPLSITALSMTSDDRICSYATGVPLRGVGRVQGNRVSDFLQDHSQETRAFLRCCRWHAIASHSQWHAGHDISTSLSNRSRLCRRVIVYEVQQGEKTIV